jgi:hypothetical protein
MAGELTIGVNVLKWLGAGLAAKLVRDEVAGDAVTAVGFDLGARSNIPIFGEPGNPDSDYRIVASAVVRNLGTRLRPATSGAPADDLPAESMAGLGLAKRGLFGGLEYVAERDRDSQMGIGASWIPFFPLEIFAVRLGTDGLWNPQRQLCAGFTLGYRKLKVDYAFQTNSVGDSHRIALTLSIDRSKTAPAAATKAPAGPRVSE